MTRNNLGRTLKIMGLALLILSLDLVWPDQNLIPILAAIVMVVWVVYQLWLNYMGWQPPTQPQSKAGGQHASGLFSIT